MLAVDGSAAAPLLSNQSVKICKRSDWKISSSIAIGLVAIFALCYAVSLIATPSSSALALKPFYGELLWNVDSGEDNDVLFNYSDIG